MQPIAPNTSKSTARSAIDGVRPGSRPTALSFTIASPVGAEEPAHLHVDSETSFRSQPARGFRGSAKTRARAGQEHAREFLTQ
jgi:hypothetical protein